MTSTTIKAIPAAMIAAGIVHVGYWPSDSTEVVQGTARYLVFWLLTACAVSLLSAPPRAWRDLVPEALVGLLAAWMVVSSFANRDIADLRSAANESGWWLAMAAVLITARTVMRCPRTALATQHLIIATAIGVSFCGWHQQWIGFPALIAQYEEDPDAVLRAAGVAAEPGSSMRMVFENRLRDGGPTGTFALSNSMAAMLVGGWVLLASGIGLPSAAGWTSDAGWTRGGGGAGQGGPRWLTWTRRLAWTAAMLLIGGMILASRSRSAVIALAFAAALAFLLTAARRSRDRPATAQRTRWTRSAPWFALAILSVLGIGIAVPLAMRHEPLAKTEWISQAPQSLQFRVRYWQSSLQMVAEAPWFGVAPGQFKARYELYRAESAHEQIADPHNFFVQTLTTGGVPAGTLLVLLLVAMAIRWKQVPSRTEHPDAREMQGESNASAVYLGAIVSVVAVWFWGLAVMMLPSGEAFWGTILGSGWMALSVGGLVPGGGSAAERRDHSLPRPYPSIAPLVATTAMLVTLLTSGGWTVPGVSLIVLVLAAISVPSGADAAAVGHDSARKYESGKWRKWRWALGAAFGSVLISWYLIGIRPVEQSRAMMNRFETNWIYGRWDLAEVAAEASSAADPWAVEPSMQLAHLRLARMVRQPGVVNRVRISQWQRAEAEATLRSPADPNLWRRIGEGRIWFYQRFGDRERLLAAREALERAVELSPSSETHAAQLAEILRELEDPRAKSLALRADHLSRAGGFYERLLSFTMIASARVEGEAVAMEVKRLPAAELLAAWLLPQSDGEDGPIR